MSADYRFRSSYVPRPRWKARAVIGVIASLVIYGAVLVMVLRLVGVL